MSGRIFLVNHDEQLVPLADAPYASEDRLQRLLADYPDLLAGEQIDAESPRRWLLIDREVSVPDQEDGGGRWAMDHLFLDQDGIPTIVEVKRASDSRTRREVVGQMLDYAANAVVYWPVERLQSLFASNCEARGIDPDAALIEAFGDEFDEARYWEDVKTNLRAGKVRIVFVVDRMPRELQRIVEFLNEQMDPAEVLAVEIKQYVGGDLRALVPRVIGNTAESNRRQAPTSGAKWNETTFVDALTAQGMVDEAEAVAKLLGWFQTKGLAINWGRGKHTGYFMPRLRRRESSTGPGAFSTEGVFWLDFWRMTRPPFDAGDARRELVTRLNVIGGIDVPPEAISTDSIALPLAPLAADVSLQHFIEVLDWFFDELANAER